MRAISIILGVLLIVGGISCLGTPLLTFIDAGYFLVIMLLVHGIFGIISGIANKSYGLGFLFSILTLLFASVMLFVPGAMIVEGMILLGLMAAWFIIRGVISVYTSIKSKDENSMWVLLLIIGILDIIVGIFSFAHPVFLALTAGVILSVYFIFAGIDMIIGRQA